MRKLIIPLFFYAASCSASIEKRKVLEELIMGYPVSVLVGSLENVENSVELEARPILKEVMDEMGMTEKLKLPYARFYFMFYDALDTSDDGKISKKEVEAFIDTYEKVKGKD